MGHDACRVGTIYKLCRCAPPCPAHKSRRQLSQGLWLEARLRVPLRRPRRAQAVHGSPCPAGARDPSGSCAGTSPDLMAPSPYSPAPALSLRRAARSHRLCSLRPPVPTPPASVSCLRCSPFPAHHRGQGAVRKFAPTQSAGECERQQKSCIGHQAGIVEGYADALGTLGCYHL